MVVCSNCGFKATATEYNMSKHIRKVAAPQVKAVPQRGVPQRDEEALQEISKSVQEFFDKYTRTILYAIASVIIFIVVVYLASFVVAYFMK